MSVTPMETELPLTSSQVNGVGGSLRDRLRAKRLQLQQDRTFKLPVHGFTEEGIWARYRVLSYEELRSIGEKHQRIEGTTEGEVCVAADTLLSACQELLHKHPDGTFEGLGTGWGAQAARELFGCDSLPDEATGRVALREIFTGASGTTNMMLHFADYDARLRDEVPEQDEAVRGESAAR